MMNKIVRVSCLFAILFLLTFRELNAHKSKLYEISADTTTSKVNINVRSSFDRLSKEWIAFAVYENEINKNGWSRIEIETNGHLNDTIQAYFVGLLEAFVTRDLITSHFNNVFHNYCENETQYCERLTRFLRTTLEFAKRNVIARRDRDSYWHQIGLVLEQMQGMNAMLELINNNNNKNNNNNNNNSNNNNNNNNVVPTFSLTSTEINVDSLLNSNSVLWLNLITELPDLEVMLNRTVRSNVFPNNSCSALIKLINETSDVLVSHNAWITYNFMLRIAKKYSFNYRLTADVNSKRVPGRVMAMSSYPGVVFSVDDYYILSSGLVVLETSIENFNYELYKQIKPDDIVFEFIRNLIANRLANDGEQWTSIFAKHNSGTYNNQFMIVDYNQFKRQKRNSSSIFKNILRIIEQSPGKTESADVTDILRSQEYWASYNIPFFTSIYERESYPTKKKEFGNYYDYNKTARAMIFRRDNRKVIDLSSMLKLMRYNDYTNDPLSRCDCSPPYSAHLAIAARGDLNDPNGTYPMKSLGFTAEGAIDVKVTSGTLMSSYEMIAISGPTYETLPPFKWSTFALKDKYRHEGHPNVWKFPPVHFKWLFRR